MIDAFSVYLLFVIVNNLLIILFVYFIVFVVVVVIVTIIIIELLCNCIVNDRLLFICITKRINFFKPIINGSEVLIFVQYSIMNS